MNQLFVKKIEENINVVNSKNIAFSTKFSKITVGVPKGANP